MSDPDNREGFGSINNEAVITDSLRLVDAERSQKGSYYSAVPQEYREAIDNLVTRNFEFYKEIFANNRPAFVEAMAQNWLVKNRAFGMLFEAAGFRKIERAELSDKPEPNNSEYAALSQNSSWLAMGARAFNNKQAGAEMTYEKLPLREAEPLKNVRVKTGAFFLDFPRVGEGIRTNLLRTSKVIALYTREAPPKLNQAGNVAIDKLTDSVTQTFHGINDQTLHGRRPAQIDVNAKKP